MRNHPGLIWPQYLMIFNRTIAWEFIGMQHLRIVLHHFRPELRSISFSGWSAVNFIQSRVTKNYCDFEKYIFIFKCHIIMGIPSLHSQVRWCRTCLRVIQLAKLSNALWKSIARLKFEAGGAGNIELLRVKFQWTLTAGAEQDLAQVQIKPKLYQL